MESSGRDKLKSEFGLSEAQVEFFYGEAWGDWGSPDEGIVAVEKISDSFFDKFGLERSEDDIFDIMEIVEADLDSAK